MLPYTLGGDRRLRRYAGALDDSPDYRVLRRLPRIEEMWFTSMPHGPDIRIGVVDIETTGLAENAKIIEIALVKVSLIDGQLGDMTSPLSMFEDPGEPLADDIARLTGLSDLYLAGKRFDEELLADQLDDVDVLLAFNASFDIPRLRRRFDWLDHPAVCAMRDYDWAGAGYEGRTQRALLNHAGLFYSPHRAEIDTAALAVLISLPAADGRTIAAHIVDHGKRPRARIAAHGAPIEIKNRLRERGYRWESDRRMWTIEVDPAAAADEERALRTICQLIRPQREVVDWYDRYSG